MGPVEALELAKSKEEEAVRMYEKLSQEYPAAKEIFIFLMAEEEKHRALIEKKIYDLTK